MTSLHVDFPGAEACINASNDISCIIDDLDNTIMLATAGNLQEESKNETFSYHRENILKEAKALTEDTKCLIAGVAASQEKLVVAVQNVFATFTQLADIVKYAAASLGDSNPETQVLLINALKGVAIALRNLIPATKDAFGKTIDDVEMSNLKDSAQVMVTNVRLLLQNVKSVTDENSGGTRDSESTIEATGQEHIQTGNMEIIRLEKELELAKQKLAAIRKVKYEKKALEENQSKCSQ